MADIAPSGAEIDEIAALNPGSGAPDAQLIAALQQVLLTGASDLHIASGATPMLRVDGGLNPIAGYEVWDRAEVRERLYSLLTDDFTKRFEENLELDFAYTLSANARFRVNYYQDRGSMGAAFRIIPTHIKNLKELGIAGEVGSFSTLPRGLVLVTGPTGSGKSTTLAALIDLVNETRRDHVVTVEDPIEFMHKNKKSLINQREVGRDTHSFGNALKHVLRQDPDVILIGELRDLETISIALTAAETGHLVFATLHTQSAPTTIDRVIDVFPPHQQDQVRTQLAATLQGVVCQTLVKKASGSGRAVATEVMFTTPAISNLVREGKTYQITSALQSGGSQGMHTMDQALAELVNEGTITRAAAMEKSQDPETLERLITRVDMNAVGSEGGFVALDFDYDQKGRH
ncbi:type IV pilus twitching motility protein PilT [Schumannella sp. 10F1B-5-1]|nr:type IV pilus twitching motility protein PilT [Schumannella sp. 10F1B-5-1]